jgi:iron-sulfur cluster repair protein YtfE (RIC family)
MDRSDPVRQFEHAHGQLNRLVLEVAESIRDAGPTTPKAWQHLYTRLSALRDELLRHFADEEEALFPFVRASVPAKVHVVDRLEGAHDTICGSIVRMVHVAGGGHQLESIRSLHERFEHAYTQHSSEEAALFEELGRVLDGAQRNELTKRLHGL